MHEKSFNKSYFKKLPIGLLVLLILFSGALFLFAYIVHEVLRENEQAVDEYIFGFLSAHVIDSSLTGFMKSVTYLASAGFLQIAYGVLIVLFLILKNFRRVVEIFSVGLGGFLVTYFMKLAFHRSRPPHPLMEPLQNFSFPSGHATSGFIFYGLLAYLILKTDLNKTYKYISACILILLSLLIGFSRIYLRMHYPSDVLAGFCVGFAWLLLNIALFERLKNKSLKEQDESSDRTFAQTSGGLRSIRRSKKY